MASRHHADAARRSERRTPGLASPVADHDHAAVGRSLLEALVTDPSDKPAKQAESPRLRDMRPALRVSLALDLVARLSIWSGGLALSLSVFHVLDVWPETDPTQADLPLAMEVCGQIPDSSRIRWPRKESATRTTLTTPVPDTACKRCDSGVS